MGARHFPLLSLPFVLALAMSGVPAASGATTASAQQRDRAGAVLGELFAEQEAQGFQVFRPYDGPGGIEEEIRAIASDPRNQDLVELHDIGGPTKGATSWRSA